MLIVILFTLLIAKTVHSTKQEIVESTGESEVIKPIPQDDRANRIDAYYSKRNMPLSGYGKKIVEEADKYGIDWRLVAAISVKEQSGGKVLPYNCEGGTLNHNAWGWGSGSICFESFDQGIETVSKSLGTSRYYKDKTLDQILDTYNPPSIAPTYNQDIKDIMDMF